MNTPASSPRVLPAALDRLAAADLTAEVERFESLEGGGLEKTRRRALVLDGARLESTPGGLALVLERSPAVLEVAPSFLGLPRDWGDWDDLVLEVRAAAPCVVTAGAAHTRGRLEAERALAAGEAWTAALDIAELPLAAGNQPSYQPFALRWTVSGEPGAMILLTGAALRDAGRPKRPPVVDRFGQRIRADWPGKVRNEADLLAERKREAAQWAATPGVTDRTATGGWASGPRRAATGFFRVEQIDGRWWFIDPDGALFWSAGVTGVRIALRNETTRVTGREHLFTELPPDRGAGGRVWFDADHFSFYRWNVLRKHGSETAWHRHVQDRLRHRGLNTLGNWCDEALLASPGVMPHTRLYDSRRSGVPTVHPRFPDVFDPAWAAAMDAGAAVEVAPHAGDRNCLGWFVDNELPWRGLRLLDAAPGSAVKQAWLSLVRERHGTSAAAGTAWGRPVPDWAAVEALQAADVPAEGALADDARELLARFADRYFAVVQATLRRHAPHHLYLGCRFVRGAPDEVIVAAAGRHCDVVTVNCYAWEPEKAQFDAWHAQCGRPILIGEHHVSLASPRQLPPLWRAFSEAEREEYFRNFLETWARRTYSVGCHWFQHADQPPSGRFDGENQTIGLVDITDRPHAELERAMRETLPHVYRWHAAAG